MKKRDDTKWTGPYLDKRSGSQYYTVTYKDGTRSSINVDRDIGLIVYSPPVYMHGTQERYRRGCHCHECKTAHSVYMRPYNERYKAKQAKP